MGLVETDLGVGDLHPYIIGVDRVKDLEIALDNLQRILSLRMFLFFS